MQHFYVDGYNLLFHLTDAPDADLESQREEVLDIINHHAALLHLSITVVFDAGSAPVTHRYRHRDIEVAFADEITNADEWIHEHVEHSAHPKAITVVTNDRRLALDCRQLGAKTQSVSAWMRALDKAVGKAAGKRQREIGAPSPTKTAPSKKTPRKRADRPAIPPDDPSFLQKQPGETEEQRWHRIFEARMPESE